MIPLCSPVSLLFIPRDSLNGVAKVVCVLTAIDYAIQHLTILYNSLKEQISKGPYFNDGRLNKLSSGCLKPNRMGKKLLSSLPASVMVRRSIVILLTNS